MRIKSLAGSSDGCCYVVESGGEQLLIECGIPLKKIREALNFDLSNVVGCLVSHEHQDHSMSLESIIENSCIPCYGPLSYREKWSSCKYNYTSVYHDEVRFLGKCFIVRPLDLLHDTECFGYIISDRENALFYATDTGEIPYNIPGITHLMVEANYDLEILIDSETNKVLRSRVADNHLSIDQAIEFAEHHKETLKEVHLLHLSDRHSDEALFLRKAQERLGIPVYIAKK